LTEKSPSILATHIKIPAILQVLSFLGATVLILMFGWETYR